MDERQNDDEKPISLTDRERQILVLIQSGHKPEEVAEKLQVSRVTVERTMQRISHLLD